MKQVDFILSDRTFSPEEAESIMVNLYNETFTKSYRDPRSSEYKNGFRAAAFNRLLGPDHALYRQTLPYPIGSVQADAWFAGTEEGIRVAIQWLRDRHIQSSLRNTHSVTSMKETTHENRT